MPRETGRESIFEYIASKVRENGYSPYPNEIAAALGMNANTIRYHVGRLVMAGRIRFGRDNDYRTMRPTAQAEPAKTYHCANGHVGADSGVCFVCGQQMYEDTK